MKKWLSVLAVFFILAVMVTAIIPVGMVSADSVPLYWVGGNGSWSSTAHWSTSSGGTGGHAVPNSTNIAHFDDKSWSGTSAGTLNCDSSPCICLDWDWTAEDNPITISQAGSSNDVYGNVILNSLLIWSGNVTITLKGTGNVTRNADTTTLVNLCCNATGTYTLQDAWTSASTTFIGIEVKLGTFNTNGQAVSLTNTSASALKVDGGTLTLGASVVTVSNNTSTAAFYVTSGTVNLNSATINLSSAASTTNIFQVTGGTVNHSTETFNITSSTYNHAIFVGNGGTYNNLNVIGSAEITGNNTFNALTVNRSGGNSTLYIAASANETISSFSCATSGTNTLTLRSTTTTPATLTLASGYTNLDYLALSYITVSPATYVWFYGSNSTIGTSVTGWFSGVFSQALTSAVTNVAPTSITLNGYITMLAETSLTTTFEYGLTTGYGSSVTVTGSPITVTGAVTANVTGLVPGFVYHYRLKAVGSGTYYSPDAVFSPSISPVSQSLSTTAAVAADGCVLYNGYIYFTNRGSNYLFRVLASNLTNVTSLYLNYGCNDGIVAAGGYIWVGANSMGYVMQVDPATFTVVSTTAVLGATIYSMCADSTYVYVAGLMNPTSGNSLGRLKMSDLTTNAAAISTYPYGGSNTMIHELAVDASAIYGDVNQGSGVFKANLTTLALTASAAETTGTTSEEILQDNTYIYNITEIPTGLVQVNRFAKSNLAQTNCIITNAVHYLDSMAWLPDGSMLVGDNRTEAGGISYIYKVNSDFTYSGITYTVTGLTNTDEQVNKIILDGDYFELLSIKTTGFNPLSFARFTMLGIYAPTVTTGTASGVGVYAATVAGNVTDAGGAAVVTVGIQWGTATGVYGTTISQNGAAGPFSTPLTSLPKNTTIFYRAFVTTSAGTAYGSEQTFTTLTQISQFSLMLILLQIFPAVIFMSLLFGMCIFGFRAVKQGGTANIMLLVMCVLGLLLVLALMPSIVDKFYTIMQM